MYLSILLFFCYIFFVWFFLWSIFLNVSTFICFKCWHFCFSFVLGWFGLAGTQSVPGRLAGWFVGWLVNKHQHHAFPIKVATEIKQQQQILGKWNKNKKCEIKKSFLSSNNNDCWLCIAKTRNNFRTINFICKFTHTIWILRHFSYKN